MKKLLLLSALLIFACSSDSSHSDDNDLMEETFLEKYDGVVWNWVNFPPESEEGFFNWLMLTNDVQGYFEIEGNDNGAECVNIIFGSNDDEFAITILENYENRISWEIETNNGDDYEIVLIEASDNGDSISVSSTNEDLIRIGMRTNMPQISCD
jgi:Icc-related predicted phosphoesterase